MSKYLTLLNILDELRKEAPIEYKKYYPIDTDLEALNKARARAYIHLFLKVKFGLLTFLERENFITDDTDDGGVDAYYLDREHKRIYFLQAKFRSSEDNFENKNIELDELFNMDLDRITKGERKYINGNNYNNKIQKLIDEIKATDDYPKYKEVVIILANLKDKYRGEQIRKLTLFPAEIFDYERCYNELVFPVVSGTFYNPKELKITISVNSKSAGNRIDYYVDTSIKECNITALFVPTIEIAKILYKYKNSILKFNPRSYLDLAGGSVNSRIQTSITNIKTNEFALYNNGITMLSDNTFYSDRVGKRSEAELIVTNPQIINGGQTAFTLSRIYEDCLKGGKSTEIFSEKEGLLKVITFSEDENGDIDEASKLELIEAISKATNDQTAVTEADRRSNEKIQIEIQETIFKTYGYFYERKRGEFGDGVRSKYIDRTKIIDRETFMRVCLSINGNSGQARRASSQQLFKREIFSVILSDNSLTKKYFFGYKCLEYLNDVQKRFEKDTNNRYGQAQYGYGLRYGKIAMVGVIAKYYTSNVKVGNFEQEVISNADLILSRWLRFEEFVKSQPDNRAYFRKYTDQDSGQEVIEVNFDNYYKGKTLTKDLNAYFK
ncbi:AIPR protein [Lacibacter cauensis]|uniref:AIPR protein n=1 Tax=Lacibacter cauensis TaxID=510947 RepID=A0A562SUL7_9BACT|nr:AIPR family protein [Lacibacter cauensis]TWI84952.1 AIPR protein [Lacibacter cauensis]